MATWHGRASAQQVAARFEAMVQPVNSYRLKLLPGVDGKPPRLSWHTQEGGTAVVYDLEPARTDAQRRNVNLLSLLPLDAEL